MKKHRTSSPRAQQKTIERTVGLVCQAVSDEDTEGLPVIRPLVAGIDLGSEQHGVCAPRLDGVGREVAVFGATTPELEKMAWWLKQRKVEAVAMEGTGVYWIAPHEVLEQHGFEVALVN